MPEKVGRYGTLVARIARRDFNVTLWWACGHRGIRAGRVDLVPPQNGPPLELRAEGKDCGPKGEP